MYDEKFLDEMFMTMENNKRLIGFELAIEDLKLEKDYVEKEYDKSSSVIDRMACKVRASVYAEVIEYLEDVYDNTVLTSLLKKRGEEIKKGEVVLCEVGDEIIVLKHS